jgi:phosphate starvation-inducible PhoH-like protein
MAELTLHFETPTEHAAVVGRDVELLRAIGEQLQVQITARDLWLRLSGEEEAVALAGRFLQFLRQACHGGELRPPHVRYALAQFRAGRGAEMERLAQTRITVGPTRRPVVARTLGQQVYVREMTAHEVCFGIGPAGTGKTYLAMAMAVSHLLRGQVRRIVLTRPAVEAGEALGFLPGDLNQKIQPYLRPLYDALHDMLETDQVAQHAERGVIEVAPLAYMRGRTLNDAFIILDEAQNTTPQQMLLFLTRLGFGSRCVITGDPTQVDLPGHKRSGLHEAVARLRGVPGIGCVELGEEDVVRHPLVQRIIRAYREEAPTAAEATA